VGEENLDRLFALREADCRSRALDDRIENVRDLRRRVETELREARSFKVTDLEVDGADIIRVTGVAPGPRVGEILEALLERVLDDPGLNRRETLLEMTARRAREADRDDENGKEGR
jgi:hypothetical protein